MSDDEQEFNLRALVRDVCASSAADDPDVLAKEVEKRLRSRADRDAALAQALPTIVRWYISTARRSTAVRAEDSTVTELAGRRVRSGRSAKVSAQREYFRVAIEQRYAVNADGGYKHLRECSRDDLTFAVQARETYAARTLAKASQLAGLRDLLIRHDAATVGDLPESLLAAVLVRAA